MVFKKNKGKIFGMQLNAAERKFLDGEIKKRLMALDQQFVDDSDATILYYLHVKYGWGRKRLRDFWEGFFEVHNKLIDYYELEDTEDGWLCTQKLKDIGVDIKAWNAERSR